MQARRVLAGEDACPRWRADRASRVGVGEAHALRREPVDVRRLVERAAEAAQVAPAHVVDENEDEVGARSGFGGGCWSGYQGRQNEHGRQGDERNTILQGVISSSGAGHPVQIYARGRGETI